MAIVAAKFKGVDIASEELASLSDVCKWLRTNSNLTNKQVNVLIHRVKVLSSPGSPKNIKGILKITACLSATKLNL
jgi:hypothetical protein